MKYLFEEVMNRGVLKLGNLLSY